MSDYFKTFKQVTESNGFAYECHTVQTDDGYILNMFRVQLRGFLRRRKKPAVLLQHGLLSSADTWVINKDDVAPAFQLARAGYDVWLGNSRGSKYGRSHVSLDPDSEEDSESFWRYSFVDMGEHDLPIQIEYVRDYTQQDKITYVGHSLGAAVATVLAAAVAPALPSTRVTLCSFGSPRVGDVAFVRHCASLPNLRSWRVQNELEMVSRVAFWLPRPARYRHVEGHYFLLERGLGWCFPAGALAPFVATQAVNVINWPSYLINVFAGGMMDLKYDGRYHMTGHRNGYAAAIGRVHSWCDQAAWSWNGFSYWCQICTLTVITNLLIWASLLAVVVFTSEDSCRSSNIVQKGAPYFLIINGLCFLGIAASLCIVSRVCRDDVVRGGIVKQAIARSPNSPGNGGAATVQDTVDFLSTAGSD